MSKWISSRELMAAVGLTGPNTLIRYHKAGLIPPPEVRKHPSGRGMTSYWEDWVVFRLQRIKKLSDAGKTRAEIKEFLGTDWAAAKEEFTSSRRSRKDREELSELKNLETAKAKLNEVVLKLVQGAGSLTGKQQARKGTRLIDDDAFDLCIEMLQNGFGPVLVVQGGECSLTCDTAVSFHAHKHQQVKDSFLVIPIAKEIRSVFGIADEVDLNSDVKLDHKIHQAAGDCDVKLLGDWQIEVGPAKRGDVPKPATPLKRTRVITRKKKV